MKRTSLLIPLCWLGALLVVGNAQAQMAGGPSLMVPDEAAQETGAQASPLETPEQRAERAEIARVSHDRDQWRAYRQLTGGANGSNESGNTAAVLAQYQSWLETHPTMHPAVVAEAGIVISRLQRKSGDAQGATATLESLWEQTGESDGGLAVRAEQARLQLEAAPANQRAAAGARAQTMLEPLEERAIATSRKLRGNRFVPARELLQFYGYALQWQSKGLEMAEFARRLLVSSPGHLAGGLFQNENGWLYKQTVEALAADERPAARAQALSWAKLAWVERPFDARGVSETSKLVAQALLAQPGGAELVSQWAQAQKDPTLPNPLRAVALPVMPPGELERVLAALGEQPDQRQERVGVLLWLGQERAAMEAAVAGANQLPANASAERQGVMLEVARVFKARDLNIKGANAYLAWAGQPQGENPIDVFLATVPPGAATPAALVGAAP